MTLFFSNPFFSLSLQHVASRKKMRYSKDILFMAKTSTFVRSQKKPKFSTRKVNRCFRCGRGRGYIGDFGVCRICLRELANEGMIPGMRKSSW